ncbi:protein of unknown function [Clostridium collagenovorans DSM 3089]|uniref:Carbohydrate-binding domain-containing protein n=1 Tax=Clostridium collagenovorans DSM 3089 TaxID=1121306 RepID=A0A1M5SB76_9CLOT|nr:carbohydrate-binding domain-containing protein [Clostridium collagenovorans]SHH35711.1 protein of unknown function [Clostridium collagenovorans DSM 3089]
MKKKLIMMLFAISICTSVVGCTKNENTKNIDNTSAISENNEANEVDTTIQLGDEIIINGDGAVAENNKVKITSSGTYEISGKLEEGQIIVEAGDEDNVDIILNGAEVSCSNSSPIYIKNAKNASIKLLEGTESKVTDGANYVLEDTEKNEPDAAIFSKCDLKIKGTGSLIVDANYNNGIASKDDLEIKNGNITVTAINDAIRGRDSIVVTEGVFNINSGGDAMESNNDEDAERGYITIDGGKFNINTSSKDIATQSSKGIKAITKITINNGEFEINSADDGIHSNGTIEVNGGNINISSGDDGIHADSTLDINDGNINIFKSYEGLESETININNGNICIVASDDGINASGGNDGSAMNGRPGQNKFQGAGKGAININGGYVYVNANGDGIDANGSISMSNGTVIVNGPEDNGNGALDYDGSFDMKGGILVAAGSLGMAQSPSTSSTQNSVNIMLKQQAANTLIHIENENGAELLTFAPSKTYQSVVICSPEIKMGESYKVYLGGTSTGALKDGVYSNGKYSGGTEKLSFTVSSNVTTISEEGVNVGKFNNKPGEGQMPEGRPPMSGAKPQMPVDGEKPKEDMVNEIKPRE